MDKVKTMKIFFKLSILFLIVSSLVSCNDPIFNTVFGETPILKPFIDGSPTNFAEYGGKLYVASGKQIYSYNGSSWSKWKKLSERIGGLAATTGANGSLYAFYLENDKKGRIRNCTADSDVSLSGNVQSIHASGDTLFASVRESDSNYKFHFKKGSADFKEIPETISKEVLKGVAFDGVYYYLCTYYGIFYVEASQINTESKLPVLLENEEFTGIINLEINNRVAAITRKGNLYEIYDKTTSKKAEFSNDRYSSGALAVWYRYKGDTSPSLLLVGRSEHYYSTNTGYTNGYVEITLDAAGISGSEFNDPGKGTPTSVDDYDPYVSSLGKKPVNHLLQAPEAIDSEMTLFASTHQNGVWSYRYRSRDEKILWNAEQ